MQAAVSVCLLRVRTRAWVKVHFRMDGLAQRTREHAANDALLTLYYSTESFGWDAQPAYLPKEEYPKFVYTLRQKCAHFSYGHSTVEAYLRRKTAAKQV